MSDDDKIVHLVYPLPAAPRSDVFDLMAEFQRLLIEAVMLQPIWFGIDLAKPPRPRPRLVWTNPRRP